MWKQGQDASWKRTPDLPDVTRNNSRFTFRGAEKSPKFLILGVVESFQVVEQYTVRS